MKRIALCSLLLALYGCQTSLGEKPPSTPATLSAEQVKIVEDGIRSSLKDPNSAVFGSMKAAQSDKAGIMHVCGTVNAKNSFGGFSGQKPYIGVLGSLTTEGKTIGVFNVISHGNTSSDAEVVMSMCKHYGVI